MWIVFACPNCQRPNVVEVTSDSAELRCSTCTWRRPVAGENRAGQRPSGCLVCGCSDLWRKKDFPQRLGVLVVAIGGLLYMILQWFMEPLWAIGVLLLFALIDGVLYTAMRDVLVCYRCQARHRQTPLDGRHARFNLETHERYRQEAIRIEESQQARR